MKSLISILVSFAAACSLCAQQTGLETRVKVTSSKDGKRETIRTEFRTNGVLVRLEVASYTKGSKSPDTGYTKLYQSEKLVFEEIWGPGKTKQRNFYRDGSTLFGEIEKDGDGVFEWMVVYRENGDACAVFSCVDGHKVELMGANAAEAYNEGAGQAKALFQVFTNKPPSGNGTAPNGP